MLALHAYISWQEIVEALCFAALFFHTCRALQRYGCSYSFFHVGGYITLCLGAHLLTLPALLSFLIASAPVTLVLYALSNRHEAELPVARVIEQPDTHKIDTSWPATLISSIMAALTNNTDIYCLIEGAHSAHKQIKTAIPINAPLTKTVLETLLTSPRCNHAQMLWITSTGTITGINATWNKATEKSTHPTAWHTRAIYTSSRQDTLFLHADPITRLFTLIADGNTVQNLTAHKTLALISRRLRATQPATPSPGESHVSPHTKTNSPRSHT